MRRSRRRIWLLLAFLVVAAAFAWPVAHGGSRHGAPAAGRAVRVPSRARVLAAWRPAACVLFAPTRGNRGITVFVDPGHGGLDVGALGTTSGGRTVEEKGVALAIGLAVLALLRRDGYTVVMSRVTDTLVATPRPGGTVGRTLLSAVGLQAELRSRVACANARRARVLLGIHLNAFSDPSVGGSETIYGAGRPFSAKSRSLAAAVGAGVTRALAARGWAVPARGVVSDVGQGAVGLTARSRAYNHLLELGPRDPGYFEHPSQMPGVIAEPLFITNPAEASIAASSQGQWAVARGLVAGVRSWLLHQPRGR